MKTSSGIGEETVIIFLSRVTIDPSRFIDDTRSLTPPDKVVTEKIVKQDRKSLTITQIKELYFNFDSISAVFFFDRIEFSHSSRISCTGN